MIEKGGGSRKMIEKLKFPAKMEKTTSSLGLLAGTLLRSRTKKSPDRIFS